MSTAQAFSQRNLQALFDRTPVCHLAGTDRLVIFSDLHLGNGGTTDDFLNNSDMFARVLREYYHARGDTLILNGDVEELQRFQLNDILKRWTALYALFDAFRKEGRLHRLVGNHDMELVHRSGHDFIVADALRYEYGGHPLFVFHGHQTMIKFERYNRLVGFGLRYFANPLGIRNYSVAYDSGKRYRTERRAYEFAAANQIVALMGHTHRPLFESLSKVDSLRFEIERLCRIFPQAEPDERERIENSIRLGKQELNRVSLQDRARISSLYNANLLIPCIFNSGTVIGSRGMTCIEIHGGRIELVHWFDEVRSQKYLEHDGLQTENLPATPYHRVAIKSETLEYIFTRIRLLAGS